MSTFVIGDIQGCFAELERLLKKIGFDSSTDKLLFAGDLVNRGPDSLSTLRFVKDLGDSADSVLGNHDLHLLAIWQGNESHASGNDLDPILQAPDRDELLDWLRYRPMLIHLPKFESTIIHAGLPPQWTLQDAMTHANEVENILRGDRFADFFLEMYGNKPKKWKDSLEGFDRLRFITNCFTRMRYCTADGKLNLKDKWAPGTQKPDSLPWFDVPGRKTRENQIFFGHWSTLGLVTSNNAWSLDTGCLWGGQLTAIRLEDLKIYQVECEASRNPKAFA